MADEDISLNLPWRWESPPADKGLVVLVDSTGRTLIYGVGSEPGWARVPTPYVRAVTERAGAMHQMLVRLVAMIGDVRPTHPIIAAAARELADIEREAKAGGGGG